MQSRILTSCLGLWHWSLICIGMIFVWIIPSSHCEITKFNFLLPSFSCNLYSFFFLKGTSHCISYSGSLGMWHFRLSWTTVPWWVSPFNTFGNEWIICIVSYLMDFTCRCFVSLLYCLRIIKKERERENPNFLILTLYLRVTGIQFLVKISLLNQTFRSPE